MPDSLSIDPGVVNVVVGVIGEGIVEGARSCLSLSAYEGAALAVSVVASAVHNIIEARDAGPVVADICEINDKMKPSGDI